MIQVTLNANRTSCTPKKEKFIHLQGVLGVVPSMSTSSSSSSAQVQRITARVVLVQPALDLGKRVDRQLVQVGDVLVPRPEVVAVAGELVDEDEEEKRSRGCQHHCCDDCAPWRRVWGKNSNIVVVCKLLGIK